jgi:hypothetical protein
MLLSTGAFKFYKIFEVHQKNPITSDPFSGEPVTYRFRSGKLSNQTTMHFLSLPHLKRLLVESASKPEQPIGY